MKISVLAQQNEGPANDVDEVHEHISIDRQHILQDMTADNSGSGNK